MAKLMFGKYSGLDLEDVPWDYLEFLIAGRKKDLAEYEAELDRRTSLANASMTLVERVVVEGYRSLAKKAHPDAGGTDSEMRDLGRAKEWLLSKIGERT